MDLLGLLGHCTNEMLAFAADGETVVDNGNAPGVPYASLRTLKDNIIASGKTVVLNAVSGPVADVFADEWEDPAGSSINGRVDMSDINTWPQDIEIDRNADMTTDGRAVEGTWHDTGSDGIPDDPVAGPPRPQHAQTRCSMLAHILGERFYGVAKPADFDASHDAPAPGQGGIGAQNAVMAERFINDTTNITTTIKKDNQEAKPHGKHIDGVVSYSDGSEEIWHITGAKGEFTIEHP